VSRLTPAMRQGGREQLDHLGQIMDAMQWIDFRRVGPCRGRKGQSSVNISRLIVYRNGKTMKGVTYQML
jgi:hypothetical protein